MNISWSDIVGYADSDAQFRERYGDLDPLKGGGIVVFHEDEECVIFRALFKDGALSGLIRSRKHKGIILFKQSAVEIKEYAHEIRRIML